jgi:serine/threonine protein phosphatase PrpC
MDCPACGADNREGAHFCRMCGKELSEPPVTEAPLTAGAEEVAPEEAAAEAEAGAALSEGAMPEAKVEETPPEEPAPEAEAEEAPPEELAPEAEAEEAPPEELELLVETAEVRPEGPAPEAEATEAPTEESTDTELEEPIGEPEADTLLEAEGDAPAPQHEEAGPLAPVTPGTVIAGRYVIVEVLDAGESEILYRAHDLQRCWQCGFEGNAPDDAFCAQCGASMGRRPDARLLEVQDIQAQIPGGELVVAGLADEGRTFFLLAQPESEPQAAPAPLGIRFLVGQRSDAGLVRELDEDSMLALTLAPTYESRTGPVLGLFAVADGMGGHEGGEIASKIALQVLASEVLRTIILPELAEESAPEETVTDRLRQATMAANDAVYLARQKRENDMGTTLTTALVRDDTLFLAHVGDCRAYRWNAAGLEQLTIDHSLVASMIASGQAEPEEIYTHPHRSAIYRSIGDQPVLEVDTGVLPLAPGDRIIVCCDGLWEMVRDEGIEDVMMQEADPQTACDLLVNHANLAGGEDNISVIVVQVEAV